MKSMSDIKSLLSGLGTIDEYSLFIDEFSSDERAGVQKMVASAHKKVEAIQKELLRLEEMKKYEKEYASLGYLCGIDEVGRGPLAGPVVSAAVIMPKDFYI